MALFVSSAQVACFAHEFLERFEAVDLFHGA